MTNIVDRLRSSPRARSHPGSDAQVGFGSFGTEPSQNRT
jgi:hypothetical protein